MKVLIAEDDRVSRFVLQQQLENWGHDVTAAGDGQEAWDAFRSGDYAMVISDWMMPRMDGPALLRAIRSRPGHDCVYLILLTARSEPEDIVAGIDAGADDFLSKPFNKSELHARVRAGQRVIDLERSLEQRNEMLSRANERMKHDLDAAARVQQALLPANVAWRDGVQFAWRYLPCDELAGDSLNLFWLDETTLGFYVLDVSGHGVSSALLSVSAAHSLTPRLDRASLVLEDEGGAVAAPEDVLGRLNAAFPASSAAGQFFTVLYGVLDRQTGAVRFASAGHCGPVIIRATGRAEDVPACGFPIGILDECEFGAYEVNLAPGDRLVVYSDGISEATNPDREPFGLARMHRALIATSRQDLALSLDAVVGAVVDWRQGAHAEDDVSILAVGLV